MVGEGRLSTSFVLKAAQHAEKKKNVDGRDKHDHDEWS
jgi:hypothetical protein